MTQTPDPHSRPVCLTADTAIQVLSPAKLNLFLHITGRRRDGYHYLQTVFRLLDWGDSLTFLPTQQLATTDQPIALKGGRQLTERPQDNLIVKAAHALLSYIRSHLPSVNHHQLPMFVVDVDKHIPTGAGLGGGSSNAATTLLTLNRLWQLQLDQHRLIELAAGIGADVPIFVFGQDAIANGIGEQLSPIALPSQRFLLLFPEAHIATAELFAHSDLCRDMPRLSDLSICQQQHHYLFGLNTPYTNVFEPVVTQLSAPVAHALAYLRTLEAHTGSRARMTGTGSCVYLPLPDPIDRQDLHQLSPHSSLTQDLTYKWCQQAPCEAMVVSSTASAAVCPDQRKTNIFRQT